MRLLARRVTVVSRLPARNCQTQLSKRCRRTILLQVQVLLSTHRIELHHLFLMIGCDLARGFIEFGSIRWRTLWQCARPIGFWRRSSTSHFVGHFCAFAWVCFCKCKCRKSSLIFTIQNSAFDEYYGQALRVRRLICDEFSSALAKHRTLLAPTVASFDVPLEGGSTMRCVIVDFFFTCFLPTTFLYCKTY